MRMSLQAHDLFLSWHLEVSGCSLFAHRFHLSDESQPRIQHRTTGTEYNDRRGRGVLCCAYSFAIPSRPFAKIPTVSPTTVKCRMAGRSAVPSPSDCSRRLLGTRAHVPGCRRRALSRGIVIDRGDEIADEQEKKHRSNRRRRTRCEIAREGRTGCTMAAAACQSAGTRGDCERIPSRFVQDEIFPRGGNLRDSRSTRSEKSRRDACRNIAESENRKREVKGALLSPSISLSSLSFSFEESRSPPGSRVQRDDLAASGTCWKSIRDRGTLPVARRCFDEAGSIGPEKNKIPPVSYGRG